MGKGKGCCGCCEDTGRSVSTYAEDGRDPVDMGLPEGIEIKNPSRRIINSDCPMCLIFLLFWAGMFIVTGEAFSKGEALRLIYGEDYLNNLCGEGNAPPGWEAAVVRNAGDPRFRFQAKDWSANIYLWIPVPYNGRFPTDPEAWSGFSASTALASAVCVSTCPTTNLTTEIDPSMSASSFPRVFTYGSEGTRKEPAAQFYAVYYDAYHHRATHRCLPKTDSVVNNGLPVMKENLDLLPGVTGVDDFFQRGYADVEEAWEVIVICSVIAVVLPFLYVLLLRCVIKPLVWLMLILLLVCLGAGGYFCFQRYLDSEGDGDPDNEHESKAYLAAAVILWVMTLLYVCFLCWFCKQINAACEIIANAGRVLTSDPTILIVPVVTGTLLLGLFCFILYLGAFVWTMEEDGETVTIDGAGQTVTIHEDYTTRENLLFYVGFGWLWTMGFISALGYFVIAASTVQWYYSHRDDDEKKSRCVVGWLRGYFWGVVYHSGCLVTGALLVAIIQAIRFLVQYFTKDLQKGSDTMKCLMCLVDCCLAYLERFLQYISRNAYIMTAIEGSGFWCSACTVVSVLLGAVDYLAALLLVSDVVFFLGKLLLTAATVCICWLLLESDLGEDVGTGVMVLILVGVIAYVLASLFMAVYESAIDSMFVLIFHETKQPKDPALYFCPGDVFKTVTGKDKDHSSMLEFNAAVKEKAAKKTEPAHE